MLNRCSANPAITSITSSPSWNGWGVDNANTRYQPAAAAQLSLDDVPRLKLKWSFGFPGARAVSGQPAIVAGRVFVSSDNGYVYALDSATGCVYWSFRADAAVRSSVAVERPAEGRPYAVYFGDARANVYAVDAVNGTQVWKTRVEEHPSHASREECDFSKAGSMCLLLRARKEQAETRTTNVARRVAALWP